MRGSAYGPDSSAPVSRFATPASTRTVYTPSATSTTPKRGSSSSSRRPYRSRSSHSSGRRRALIVTMTFATATRVGPLPAFDLGGGEAAVALGVLAQVVPGGLHLGGGDDLRDLGGRPTPGPQRVGERGH